MIRSAIGVAIVLASTGIAGVFGYQGAVRSWQTVSPPHKRVFEKLGTATPIREGVLSEKQKQHRKIYKGFESVTRGRKLRELAAERGDVDVIQVVGNVRVPRAFSLDEYLRGLTCKADAVVIGVVRSKASQLTEDGSFVFTDYELVAEEILKNNPAAPLQPGDNLTSTRTGGAVELNGRVIRALDQHNNPLEIGGKYLLYLQYLPATGAYKPFSDSLNGDTFQLGGPKAIQASHKPLPLGPESAADAEPFMSEVRAAINQACQ